MQIIAAFALGIQAFNAGRKRLCICAWKVRIFLMLGGISCAIKLPFLCPGMHTIVAFVHGNVTEFISILYMLQNLLRHLATFPFSK